MVHGCPTSLFHGIATVVEGYRGISDAKRGTYPPVLSILAESEGYKPADFDRLTEISGESGGRVEVDENMMLEAMPDFILFLPRE